MFGILIQHHSFRPKYSIKKCVPSSLLFNLYSGRIFNDSQKDTSPGIKIIGVLLNPIRYTDETHTICNRMDGFQKLVNNMRVRGSDRGLNINVDKTNLMIFMHK